MKLAIVGTEKLTDAQYHEAWRIVRRLLDERKPDVVVSGGAAGVDYLAEEVANANGISTEIYRPEVRQWDGGDRIGFKQRNEKIAYACDALVRIVVPNPSTYGSGWTRDLARRLGKPTEEITIVSGQTGETP